MKKILVTCAALIFFLELTGQSPFRQKVDSLCILCNRSTSDSEKVIALGQLANYFYTYNLNNEGDSVLREQVLIGEVSNNSNLILMALFDDAILNIGASSSLESFDRTTKFIQEGINYARANNKYDYLVLGYVRMSNVFRKRSDFDKALLNCVSALSYFQNVTSDSIKALTYIELGETYLDRGQAVSACTNYNNAYDIGVEMKSTVLESKVHHCLAEMYKRLGDPEKAKIELSTSLGLNISKKNYYGMMKDYFDLARLTDEKYFIVKSLRLADSLHDFKNLLNSQRLMLVYKYVVEKNAFSALKYLKEEPDLQESYLNEGAGNYFNTLGHIFFYPGMIDSALKYYKKAEAAFQDDFDADLLRSNYQQIGECLRLQNRGPEAIVYFQKAIAISLDMHDALRISFYSKKLSDLFGNKHDYKNALYYANQSILYNDTVAQQSRQNEITLLGVDRENKKHAQDLLDEQQKKNRIRNIEYVGITIAIIVLFFLMLVIGSYPVSKLTVKLMGYFFFISLFEFISQIIDSQFVSSSVHGSPLRLWMTKIAIIALLVPFQQYLERNIMHVLESRRLVEARRKFSFKKWWSDINKSAADRESLNEDQAVM